MALELETGGLSFVLPHPVAREYATERLRRASIGGRWSAAHAGLVTW